jgi:hypothetical protein
LETPAVLTLATVFSNTTVANPKSANHKTLGSDKISRRALALRFSHIFWVSVQGGFSVFANWWCEAWLSLCCELSNLDVLSEFARAFLDGFLLAQAMIEIVPLWMITSDGLVTSS